MLHKSAPGKMHACAKIMSILFASKHVYVYVAGKVSYPLVTHILFSM